MVNVSKSLLKLYNVIQLVDRGTGADGRYDIWYRKRHKRNKNGILHRFRTEHDPSSRGFLTTGQCV